MDLSGSKEFLFRHVEKIVLGLVILFVGYRVYLNLFGAEVVQPARTVIQRAKPPTPGTEIDASFWQTASPFLCPPPIEGAKYNWFYPPKTHWALWGTGVTLVEGSNEKDSARVLVRRKVVGSPQVTALTEEERTLLGLPPADKKRLTALCQIEVAVAPAASGEPEGHVLAIKAVKAGYWARVMVMLENQDRFCVPVIVEEKGIVWETDVVVGTIKEKELKEDPLGTVVIRFTAPQGSFKTESKVVTHIEPTYFEVRRKSERDKEDVEIGRVPGRNATPAEPGAAPGSAPPPKPAVPKGFPGATADAPPKPKEPAPPTKGGPTAEPGEMVFEDADVEAEVTYTYYIRSVLLPKEEGEPTRTKNGDPVSYRTRARFSFAYLGGDAQNARIRVYIGPRAKTPEEKKLEEWRDYERVPIGGWVGEVPKEFRAEAADAPAAGPAKGATPPKGKAPPAAPGEGPSARFVTRYVLVDIEQGVFRPVPQKTTRYKGNQKIELQTYRETQGQRVILRDAKNRLHHFWREEPDAPPPPGKGK